MNPTLSSLEATLRDSIRYINLSKQPQSFRIILLQRRLRARHP